MTVRENAHQLIDTLPEERLTEALEYLAELGDIAELAPETKTAIEEGLDDIRNGRTITLDQYRRTRGV